MSLRIAAQMFLIVTLIVSITDIVVMVRLKSQPEHLTLTLHHPVDHRDARAGRD